MWATEDDFQRHLDANPADGWARQLFADWLDDREEYERAAGYRALGVLGRCPLRAADGRWVWLIAYQGCEGGPYDPASKPQVWDDACPWQHGTRRAADDAAALAFARLPADVRAAILDGVTA